MTTPPSVGRIVHYTSHGTPGGEYTKECRAAIVTAVRERDPVPYVDLAVLNPTGLFFKQGCRYDDPDDQARPGGTWHWPERT